jgi:hypothetical protein
MPQKQEFRPFYAVLAWSPSRNRLMREFNEAELRYRVRLTDIGRAEQQSRAFAQRLNQEQKLGATDWQPRTQLITDQGRFLVRKDQSSE